MYSFYFYFIDIDECSPNPCQNGGQCVQQFNATYVCGCAAGYTGVNCTESRLIYALSPSLFGQDICVIDQA